MADRCELCFANRRKLYQPWIDLRERNRDGVRGVGTKRRFAWIGRENNDWQACHRMIKAGLVFLCFVNVCVVLGGMPEQGRGEGGGWTGPGRAWQPGQKACWQGSTFDPFGPDQVRLNGLRAGGHPMSIRRCYSGQRKIVWWRCEETLSSIRVLDPSWLLWDYLAEDMCPKWGRW